MGVDHGRAYVFHTWWFLALMGLLLVNLCLCSWEKSYIAITLYKKKNTVASPGFYKKAGHAVAIPWRGSLDAVESMLKRGYTVVHRNGTAFYAQKGLFGRLGATIIHIGLLWTMSAGYYRILADELGWGVFDSTVILPEGQTSDVYHTRIDRLKGPTADNFREEKMPFALRALDFTADYHPHSTVARHFSSLIELKDGDHTEIREVTMTEPFLYKGYKITQNSFSPNERVRRGKFRIFDTVDQRAVELDAGISDPVRIKLPSTKNLFLQVDDLRPGAQYHIVDLAGQKAVQSGTIAEPSRPMPLDVNLANFSENLQQSQYSFIVAALFPNFTFDEQRQPTTKDENFENPAVLVMLFKKGKPNGYTWLFLNKDAQQIVGQTHPEVDLHFLQYRQVAGSTGEKGLYDYEVEIEVREKGASAALGTFWAKAGEVKEVAGMPASILDAPNVANPAAAAGHGAQAIPADPHEHLHEHQHNHDHEPTTATQVKATIAETVTTATGGAAAPGSAAGGSTATSATPRYEVTWLGEVTGNVTFLGFMRDPSVAWLFSGCLVIIFGTLIAFVLVYREVWVYHDEEAGLLYLATAVRGTSPGAHREFDRKIAELRLLGARQATAPEEDRELVGSAS